MGQAFDRDGNVLGEAVGATKREVFEALNGAFKDAHEIRIKSLVSDAYGDQPRPAAVKELDKYDPPRIAPQRLGLGNVEDVFRYQPWNEDQQTRGKAVTEALIDAAKTILRNVPECPTRTRALNNLIDARMLANAAITHDGRY